MIYAYIFVMAGVTYLIRMLPLTLIQKKSYQCVCPVIFVLYSICLSGSHDISGNFICHCVCGFWIRRICSSNFAGF